MKKSTKKALLLALIASLLATAVIGLGVLTRLDKWVQDTLFQRPGATSPEIVIIGIDEGSFTELGQYNTWGRSVMASALEALAADPDAMPAVVAIDTLYAGETDAEADARLAAAAAKLPAVVTATMADFGTVYGGAQGGGVTVDSFAVVQYEEPYAALREVTLQGSINALYDTDGVMRHGLLYVDVPASLGTSASGRVYSMAYTAASAYAAQRGETVDKPSTDSRGCFYIPFSGAPGDFYDDVSIADLVKGRVRSDYYAGKIVLIGPYAAALQDAYFTPVNHGEQMYGVEIQANVIQSVLEGSFKKEASNLPQLIVLFLVCFGATFVFLRLGLKRSVWVALVLIAAGIGAAMGLYALGVVTHPVWLPVAVLALFIFAVVRHYLSAAMERQRVTKTFERYVAPEIVQEILKEGTESLGLGGTLCQIAVLFVDVRGFTTMSERLDPEKVVYILNKYLTMTSTCVENNHGTLDKFVGDATMAFWGAPLPMEDPIYFACKTARDIVRGAKEVSDQLKSEIGEELRVGVGVHFGPAVVGNMGSERHMDYTAIGDTVNTAARLEANAPGGMVYISRTVADALGDRAKVTSLGGSVKLKGKAEGFEVLTLDELE